MVAIIDRCTINRNGRRPMVRSIDRCILRPIVREIVASLTDRTSTRGILWPSEQSIVAPEDRWYDQSWGATIDRTINRSIVRPSVWSIVAPNDLESQVRSFEHDHRPCYDWFCPGDRPRPPRPVVRPFYDLPTIPTFPVWLGLYSPAYYDCAFIKIASFQTTAGSRQSRNNYIAL